VPLARASPLELLPVAELHSLPALTQLRPARPQLHSLPALAELQPGRPDGGSVLVRTAESGWTLTVGAYSLNPRAVQSCCAVVLYSRGAVHAQRVSASAATE